MDEPPGKRPGASGGRGMIDLPLRPESGPAKHPPTRRPSATRPPARGRRRRSPLLWIVPLLAAAVVLWWLFWPAPARVVVEPSRLAFATARVGATGDTLGLVVGNGGERALRVSALLFGGDAAADFSIEDENCTGRAVAPGESCAVAVSFQPTAAGGRGATLELESNASNSPLPVELEANAVAPRVGLAPESADFGPVEVGASASPLALTISNIGSATLELGTISFDGAQAAEFGRDRRCPETSLEPGEACRLELEFSPAAAGLRRAELVITSDAPGEAARLRLSGSGLWTGPPLEAQPTELDFGEQRQGRQGGPRTVRLVNRSADQVGLGAVAVDPAGGAFAVSSDGCRGTSLDSGAECEIDLVVTPPGEGRLDGALTVDVFGGTGLRVGLRVRGVAPKLSVLTPELDFGSLRAGFESAPQKAVFANTGSATIRVRAIRIVGPGADGFVASGGCRGVTIAPGRRCEEAVAFRPGSAGARSAELELEPADGLPPLRVRLSGQGTVAALAVEPGRLEWPAVQLGQGRSRELVLANTGTARLEIGALRITGESGADFRVGAIGCRLDAGLEPAATCELSVAFAPTADGLRAAELEIAHNGPGSPMKVALSGEGETPRPAFGVEPRDLGFGTAPLGSRSEIATLTVRNAGAAWMSLEGLRLAGDHAGDFELVPGTCDGVASLAPGGSCTVGVRFVPREAGRRRAFVEIRHGAPGSPGVVSVAGVGG